MLKKGRFLTGLFFYSDFGNRPLAAPCCGHPDRAPAAAALRPAWQTASGFGVIEASKSEDLLFVTD
jgi:hypothetical protein